MLENLKITDIGTNGDGIARDENGAVVFVPFSAAGEIVMAEVTKDADGQYRAKINSFLLKSPDRTVPPCKHFGICGGCALQHLNNNAYQYFKKNQVIGALEKAGVKMPDDFQTIFIPNATRRRANFAARVVKGKATIGFHERKSGNIRDVPDCHLITQDVARVMNALRPYLSAIIGEGAKMDVLIQCADGQTEIGLTGKIADGWEAQQALSDCMQATNAARISIRARDFEAYETILESAPVYKTFGSLRVTLAPCAFLQPSDEGERALIDCVMDGAGDASCIADLFCGNGTFSGAFFDARKIWCADNAQNSIEALKAQGMDARCRDLFKSPYGAADFDGVDCVILDPPRSGARAQILELARSSVDKIIYVSCNPQSFSSDAQILLDGGYDFKKLTLVDQFIWSTHTEVVGVFVKD